MATQTFNVQHWVLLRHVKISLTLYPYPTLHNRYVWDDTEDDKTGEWEQVEGTSKVRYRLKFGVWLVYSAFDMQGTRGHYKPITYLAAPSPHAPSFRLTHRHTRAAFPGVFRQRVVRSLLRLSKQTGDDGRGDSQETRIRC